MNQYIVSHLIGKRRFIKIGVLVVVFLGIAAIYALLFTTYKASLAAPAPAPAPSKGVTVVFTPSDVQPEDNELEGVITILPAIDLMNNVGELANRVDVKISPALVGGNLTFMPNQDIVPQRIVLPVDGVVQEYPLDRYDGSYIVAPTVTDNRSVTHPIPVEFSVPFNLAGWSLDTITVFPEVLGPDVQAGAYPGGVVRVGADLTIIRSESTKLLSLLLLALLTTLGVIAALVAIATFRGHIKAEFGPAGWLTAMLFAVMPVRGFFPGAPPMGSWIDILIVFWVILLIMLSVATVAGMLLSTSRHENRAKFRRLRQAAKAGTLDLE